MGALRYGSATVEERGGRGTLLSGRGALLSGWWHVLQKVVLGVTLRLRQSISWGEVARPAESSSGADAPSPTKYFLGGGGTYCRK